MREFVSFCDPRTFAVTCWLRERPFQSKTSAYRTALKGCKGEKEDAWTVRCPIENGRPARGNRTPRDHAGGEAGVLTVEVSGGAAPFIGQRPYKWWPVRLGQEPAKKTIINVARLLSVRKSMY